MKYSEEKYAALGKEAALAMNRGDPDASSKLNGQFRLMQSQEEGGDTAKSQAVYQNGYRLSRITQE